jgi:hypothetical protein
LKEKAGEIGSYNPHPIMNPLDLCGGVRKERGIHGMVRDETKEEEDAYGNQQNPYDLMFQFFFNGILDHYFPSLSP